MKPSVKKPFQVKASGNLKRLLFLRFSTYRKRIEYRYFPENYNAPDADLVYCLIFWMPVNTQ